MTGRNRIGPSHDYVLISAFGDLDYNI